MFSLAMVLEMLERGDPVVELRFPRESTEQQIDAEGCERIADCLRENKTAKELILVGCRIPQGTSIVKALCHNSTLERLDLSCNPGGLSIVNSVRNVLMHNNQTLHRLQLADNKIGTEGAIILAQLLQHTCLQSLNIQHNQIESDGIVAIIQSLSNNNTLQHLFLGWNRVGVRGAAAVAKCLRRNRTLLTLCLCNSGIRDKGGRLVAEALPHNATLRQLDLRCSKSLGRSSAVAMGASIRHNHSLQTLYLRFHSNECVGIVAIANGLRVNESLKKLDIQCENGMRGEAAKALGEALICNSTLEALRLKDDQFSDEGICFLARALQDPRCSLSKLGLSGANHKRRRKLSPACEAELAKAITHNTNLVGLGLSRGTVLGALILDALERNTTLQEFVPSRAVKKILERNRAIAKMKPELLQQEGLGLWPWIVAKWPPNVVFGLFRDKPDALLFANE